MPALSPSLPILVPQQHRVDEVALEQVVLDDTPIENVQGEEQKQEKQ